MGSQPCSLALGEATFQIVVLVRLLVSACAATPGGGAEGHDRARSMPPPKQARLVGRPRRQSVARGQALLQAYGCSTRRVTRPDRYPLRYSAGPDALVVLGDALTHPTISFAHPDWMPAADHHDALGAAAMRRDLLDKLRNGSPACHRLSSAVPWGRRVERRGSAYRFVPNNQRQNDVSAPWRFAARSRVSAAAVAGCRGDR